MAVRYYFVPKIGAGTAPDPFRPKYVDDDALGAGWNLRGRHFGMDYGFEAVFLLVADLTTQEHATLAAQSDVTAFPANLDATVGGALTTVQNRLEAAHLPANWVTAGHTYRQVLRAVRRIVTFMQRFQGLFPLERVFASGITLGTQLNQLTAAQRQRLQAVAASLNLDTSGVTNAMTLRQVLKLMADQLPDKTINGDSL